MQYRFILKDNNQKAYRSFVWFLFFLHVVAAGIIGLNAQNRDTKTGVYFFYSMIAVISIIYFFYKKNKKAFDIFSFIMVILYADFWLRHSGLIAAFIFISVFIFVFAVNRKKTTILFSDEGVFFKSVFKTIIYPWQKLDNVIFKDNLLTIDFKSNKLIQAEIAYDSEQTDEILFNRFCKEQLQNNG